VSPTDSGDGGGKTPLTLRGHRTRAKLIEAARVVFENDGFADARITDITREAGMSYGSFYTYFTTKEEVFGEVAREMQREMLLAEMGSPAEEPVDPADAAGDAAGSPMRIYDVVARANRRYLRSYERHARLMAVIEQVALHNEELYNIRREVRGAFVDRSTRAIARWQAAGLADPALDPGFAASALGSMVDRFGYVWFVLGGSFEMDKAVDNLTRLWVQALGMSIDTVVPPRRPS
jgi:AcrR family transcriptional regulator